VSTLKLRVALNYLRFIGRNNRIIDLGRIHPSAAIANSEFGHWSAAASYSRVSHSVLGRYTSIGRSTKVTHADIGSFCSISWDVTINAVLHPMDRLTTNAFAYVPEVGGFVGERTQRHERVQIGNDVWIGAQAIIMPGVRIGDGAVIGAGSIVTRDVEAYEVVAGNPAKTLRWRFDEELRDELLKLRWWDWSDDEIGENIRFFQKPLLLEDMEHMRSV
jgi:acetyltransferase-like isoleucine patch superfamily enzyme